MLQFVKWNMGDFNSHFAVGIRIRVWLTPTSKWEGNDPIYGGVINMHLFPMGKELLWVPESN